MRWFLREIVRAADGDATGHIFLISAAIAVVGVVAALFMRPTMLRTTLDLATPVPATGAARTVPSPEASTMPR